MRISTDPACADLAKRPIGVVGQAGGARYFDCKGNELETGGAALDADKCAELWRDTAEVLGLPDELEAGDAR